VAANSRDSTADSEFKNEFGILQLKNSAELNSGFQQQDQKLSFQVQQQKSASLAGGRNSKGADGTARLDGCN
jgi:hypothetical protein